MLDALDALMPAAAPGPSPTGGFYVWLTLPEGLDAKAMLPRAVHARVAYVPGIGFYADGDGRRNMRLSYCFPSRSASARASAGWPAWSRRRSSCARRSVTGRGMRPRRPATARPDSPGPDVAT